MRSLRWLATAAVLFVAAPSFAVTFQVLGWQAGESIGIAFNGTNPNVLTAHFEELLDGVAGSSFCVDLSQYINRGTFSEFVVYDPTAAEGEAFADGPPERQFTFAAQIVNAWAKKIGALASQLGVSEVQVVTGVQAAVWEAVYGHRRLEAGRWRHVRRVEPATIGPNERVMKRAAASAPSSRQETSVSELTIAPAELRAALDGASAPLLLDVRRKPTFEAAPSMIHGAQWRDPYQVGSWVETLPAEREVVVYCVHGLEIGRGVRDLLASIFKASGRKVRYMQGGIEQWELSGLPTIAKQPKP